MIRLKELIDKVDTKLFIDLDGVLADFDKQIETLAHDPDVHCGSQYVMKHGKKAFWKLVEDGGLEFWTKMDIMPDGRELWDFLKQFEDSHVLTAAPWVCRKVAQTGKTEWVNRHLNSTIPIIFRDAPHKKEFAGPGHILIDDKLETIEQWNAAGGIGVHHKNAHDTITQLRNVMHN